MSEWLNKCAEQPEFHRMLALIGDFAKESGKIVWDDQEERIAGIFKEAMDATEFANKYPGSTTGVVGEAKGRLYIDSIVKSINESIEPMERELADALAKPPASVWALNEDRKKLAGLLQVLKIKYQMLTSGLFKDLDSVAHLGEMIRHLEEIEHRMGVKLEGKECIFEPLSHLMAMSESDWKARGAEILNEKMRLYSAQFVPEGKSLEMSGFLERHDLDSGTEVAVIGDIHGNALRLELTLKLLQQKGFLDESFHCLPGKRIVFLGDYADRGTNTLKVLELLITFKMENRDSVHLIRGNHEDLQTSAGRLDRYAALDSKYRNYMRDEENLKTISGFYESLPVAVYLGENNEEGNREYIQFCHGLFHLYTDPAPLLESGERDGNLWVDGAAHFTPRVQRLLIASEKGAMEETEDKLSSAAKKLVELQSKMPVKFDDVYWLDAGTTFKADHYSGRVQIPPEIVKAYLQVSGTERAKVKEIIRGHQLGLWTIVGKKQEALVTTIDPSDDPNNQTFMILRTAPKVKHWGKAWISCPLLEEHSRALQEAAETKDQRSAGGA